jgi:hypothetical protein
MSSFVNSSDPSQPSLNANPQDQSSTPSEVGVGGDSSLTAAGQGCCSSHDHDHNHEEPHSDDDNIPPINRIIYPADVIDLNDDMEVVTVIGTRVGKVTKIGGFEGMKNLQVGYPEDILILSLLLLLFLVRN